MKTQSCPACNADQIKETHPRTYRYPGAGLPDVHLRGGVTLISCKSCGVVSVHVEKEWQLLQVIGLSLLWAPRHLAGPELRFLRTLSGLTQQQLATRIRAPRRATIAEREAGKHLPMGFGDEILYRKVYLDAFEKLIETPGESHLAPYHKKQLSQLKAGFWELASRIQKSGKPPIDLFQDSHEWRVKQADAA